VYDLCSSGVLNFAKVGGLRAIIYLERHLLFALILYS
jgi:hypothetical protein